MSVQIETIADYLRAMETTFSAEKAGSVHAVLQYEFTGREVGVCHAIIEGGTILAQMGAHPAPTATVRVDFDLWLRVLTHEVDGLIAWQDGLYQVIGDPYPLMESDSWFSR